MSRSNNQQERSILRVGEKKKGGITTIPDSLMYTTRGLSGHYRN